MRVRHMKLAVIETLKTQHLRVLSEIKQALK